jgi:oligopeptide transport system substrate-binding protein
MKLCVKMNLNNFFRFCCVIGCVTLGLSLLSGCAILGGPLKDTLRMNIGSEPPSLDWDVTTDSTSFDVVSNLMVGLTQYNEKLQCAPACAESWEITDGGKHYVFHLRSNVFWTDGKPVVAGDFEYAWKRLLNPKTGAQYSFFLYDIVNAFEYATGKVKDASLVGVKALDDRTLDVHLKKPAAYFIYLTAFCPTLPERKDVVEKWGDRWTEPGHIVTNGPYMLDKWAHEYKIVLVANPKYFEGKPHLKRILMFMVPEQSTAFALYENNELDYVDNRSFSTPDVTRFRHSPEYRTMPLLRANYIGFNVTKKPFDNILVRKAVAMSIDRSVFPKILRRGELPAYSWIPGPLLGYSPNSGYAYDPKQARKLLAQAGYPDGKGFPHAELLYPNREDTRTVVEAIQDQLKRNLGIHIKLVNQEWKVYLSTLHRDSPSIYKASWGADFPDPETFMNLFTSTNGNNTTRFSDPHYDSLVNAASSEQNEKRRGSLYQQADEYLCKDQVPIVPTYLSTQNLMVKPWVNGLVFNPLDIQFFKNVWIDRHYMEHAAKNWPEDAPVVAPSSIRAPEESPAGETSSVSGATSNAAGGTSNAAGAASNAAGATSNSSSSIPKSAASSNTKVPAGKQVQK